MSDSLSIPPLDSQQFYYLTPHILLAAWGLLVLTIDFALLRRSSSAFRRQVLGGLSLVGGLAALVAVVKPEWYGLESHAGSIKLFFDTISAGRLADRVDALLLILMLLVLSLSMTWDLTEHWGEYYALVLWAAVGMMLLVAAEEFLVLFLTLETMTICLYLATAFEKGRRRSAEGGLKYFVYGSVSSALFLFGLSLIYGLTGSTRFDAINQVLHASPGLSGNVAGATALLLVLVGFGFKIAAVPFHQWAPDAYEGAPAPISAWIATGSKIASVVALLKVLLHALGPWTSGLNEAGGLATRSPGWIGLVAVIAAVTMTFGNFAALAQRNFKRLLAYSSISHAGYILVGVLAAAVSMSGAGQHYHQAAGAVLYYLVVYGFATVGAFAVAAWLARDGKGDDIDDLDGLGARSPLLAVCLTLLMLSLIGVPPLAGFFGKFSMFAEALNVDEPDRSPFLWLVALGLLNSVISAFYYVRVLKAMFLRSARRGPSLGPAPASVWLPIVASTLVVLVYGIQATPLLEEMNTAARTDLLARDDFGSTPLPARTAPPPRTAPTPPQPPAGMPDDVKAFARPGEETEPAVPNR